MTSRIDLGEMFDQAIAELKEMVAAIVAGGKKLTAGFRRGEG